MPEDNNNQDTFVGQNPEVADLESASTTSPMPSGIPAKLDDHSSQYIPDGTLPVQPHHLKSRKKLYILISIGLTLLILIGFGVWYYLSHNKKISNNSSATVSVEKKQVVVDNKKPLDPELEKFINPTTGEKWLPEPKQLADLKLYTTDVEAKYYEVGSRGNNKIIKSVYLAMVYVSDLFEQDATGKISYIVKPDAKMVINSEDLKNIRETFVNKVVFDDKTSYDSLTIPSSIDLGGGILLKRPQYTLGYPKDDTDKDSSKPVLTELKKFGQSTLNKSVYTSNETKLSSISYELTNPIKNEVSLIYEPIETDLSNYQWKIGQSVASGKISPITKGCGRLNPSVTEANNVTPSNLVEAGRSPSGKQVYALSSQDHELFKKAYQEFYDFYKDDKQDKYKASMTPDDFAKNHALVLYKDTGGKILAYVNDDYRPQYGCAKPVVYLYPTSTRQVNVRVGADVKVSEPFYNPATGWQNVLASPSGLLSYQGRTYSSLFWEGPGYGKYPLIDKGVVVPTSEAINTIRSQLNQQGLNAREIADFVEYWQPNLPDKPYTRISWLSTNQMNHLAPLQISPKPQTVIRVFLDFDGLNQPIKLQPQTFKAPKRDGFTVVEWGGLSKKQLY